MWITEREQDIVCKYCLQLQPDMTKDDILSYLNVLKSYCDANSRDGVFEKLKKDEVVDFCYRTEYPDHYAALDNRHKQAIRMCVVAVMKGIGENDQI